MTSAHVRNLTFLLWIPHLGLHRTTLTRVVPQGEDGGRFLSRPIHFQEAQRCGGRRRCAAREVRGVSLLPRDLAQARPVSADACRPLMFVYLMCHPLTALFVALAVFLMSMIGDRLHLILLFGLLLSPFVFSDVLVTFGGVGAARSE